MIPDSHAHLDMIEGDTAEVVDRARSAGVSPIITIGITIESSIEAVRHAATNNGVFAAVGIHPNDTAATTPEEFERLEEIARSSDRVVAIGETGLDYYRERTPADRQKWAFARHAQLAKKLGKALIVHDREAHADVLDLLAEYGPTDTPVILHCFSGDERVLSECLQRGYFVSWAGPLTFKNNDYARRLAAMVPLERLLVETDSPFLSPEPYRGKPNFPERVRLVAETLAGVCALPLEEMEYILTENARSAFGIELTEG
ncbi:MAG TPA: TatD family hydrolase [Candidatus Anoxymicrobiaceae bacterium]